MIHVAICKGLSQYGTPTDDVEAALKYDGDTLTIVGSQDFIDGVSPYFSSKESDWWNEHRFSEQPFRFISDYLWTSPPENAAEDAFNEAFVRLNGSKIKTIHYPRVTS